MRYKEYLVKLDGSKKILGVFGEQHIYTQDASRFVRKIMHNFDTIVIEGTNQKSSLFWIGILYIPVTLAYVAGTKKSFDTLDTAKTIAEEHGKRVVRLEEDIEHLLPLTQKIALAIAGTVSIPMSPFVYSYCRFYGDPYEVGTKAYERRMAKEREGKKSLFSGFLEYAFKNNEEDSIMAERSVGILKDSKNLLVVCGEGHLDGLVRELSNKLRLKEIGNSP